MSEPQGASGPQFRADRPEEQQTVSTTIVGGRPPGSGQPLGQIPRGIEVLVKKAAIDPEFKTILLDERAKAAEQIGLDLDPAETLMLAAVPSEQLETIIAQTTVPQQHRRAFLGQAAAAMLAAVGLMAVGCPQVQGIRPDRGSRPDDPEDIHVDRPPVSGGERPDLPPAAEPSANPPEEERLAASPTPDQAADEPLPPPPPPAPTGIRPDPVPPKPNPDRVTRGIRPDRIPVTQGARPGAFPE